MIKTERERKEHLPQCSNEHVWDVNKASFESLPRPIQKIIESVKFTFNKRVDVDKVFAVTAVNPTNPSKQDQSAKDLFEQGVKENSPHAAFLYIRIIPKDFKEIPVTQTIKDGKEITQVDISQLFDWPVRQSLKNYMHPSGRAIKVPELYHQIVEAYFSYSEDNAKGANKASRRHLENRLSLLFISEESYISRGYYLGDYRPSAPYEGLIDKDNFCLFVRLSLVNIMSLLKVQEIKAREARRILQSKFNFKATP